MNIVLIGYRCSGKSVVGKIVAKNAGLRWVDTDQLLEKKVGCSIGRYVAENGWERFRMVEKMIIRSVSGQDRQVIATGGGAVLDWENVCFLSDGGWVVWLQAGVSTIRARMMLDEASGDVRPGLVKENPLHEIEQVLKQRTPLYDRASDFTVNTDQKSPQTVSMEILRAMPQGLGHLQDRHSSKKITSMAALTA